MLLVLVATIIITVNRFDLTLANDRFAVDWAVGHSSSLEFIGYYSLLNFYIFAMALVYAPPPIGCEQGTLKSLFVLDTLLIEVSAVPKKTQKTLE